MTDPSDRCLREQKFGSRVFAVDWSPDGTRLVIGDGGGAVEVLTAEGRRLWRRVESQSLVANTCWSPDGSRLAAAANDQTVRIWDAQEGTVRVVGQTTDKGVVLSWSPDGRRLACGSGEVILLDTETGEKLDGWSLSGENAYGVSWSPDGSRLAAGFMSGSLRLREDRTHTEVAFPKGHTQAVGRLAWTRDSQRLASASRDNTVRVWNVQEKRCVLIFGGHRANVNSVSWSPDGTLLASGSGDRTVRIWSSESGKEVALLDGHAAWVWTVAFSPDGTRVASASGDKTVRIWDVSDLLPARPGRARAPALEDYVVRQAATIGRQPASGAPTRPVERDLRPLPNAFAQLARLGLAVPLSHLRAVFSILNGTASDDETLVPLTSHPIMCALVALRWRAAARPGLAALLLKDVPHAAEWTPPSGASSTELRNALTAALAGEPVPAAAPTLPVAALKATADAIDERFLTLLTLVGPDAVAADPGLPLRLLPQVPKLPAMTAPKRRLLGLRLRLDQGGPAHGHGAGAERTGIDVRGDWRSIVPWQLALPDTVLRARFVRHEILYRARSGEEPPRLRPTVLVLDVSPPVFGPVEKTTRLAAHVVASSLLDAGLPVVLVTAGGRGSVRTLERPADLVEIWTERSLEGADEPGVLRVARAMRETLADGVLAPVVVLLSHVFFGADFEMPEVPSLRGLFVDYPGRRVRPPLSAACERWESVGPGEVEGLGERLGRLVG